LLFKYFIYSFIKFLVLKYDEVSYQHEVSLEHICIIINILKWLRNGRNKMIINKGMKNIHLNMVELSQILYRIVIHYDHCNIFVE